MVLSDEDRARIEEEELYRAEARIRAEAEIRQRIAAEEAESIAIQCRSAAEAKAKSRPGPLGCFGMFVVGAILLMVLADAGKNGKPSSATGKSVSSTPSFTSDRVASKSPQAAPPLNPEQQAAAAKKAAEEGAAAKKKAAEQAVILEDSRQYNENLKWWYSEYADDMGRGTVRVAYVKSQNQVSFDFPYTGAQRATLSLRVHPKYGKDVILRIEKGQFLCRYDGCHVTVVFGDGKPVRFSASEASDNSSEVLFIRDYDRFVASLRKVGQIRIEAAFFQEGERTFVFTVKDLEWK